MEMKEKQKPAKSKNKINFNDADITTLPLAKEKSIDYTSISKKYPSLILRVGKKKKVFYYKVHTKTPTLNVGFHFIADVTNFLSFENVVLPAYRKFQANINASKKLTTGFSKVTMEEYLDNYYRVDALDSNKVVSDGTLEKLKLYFSHSLEKRCVVLNDDDYKSYVQAWPNHSESTRRKVYYSYSAMLNTLAINEKIISNPLKKRKFKKYKNPIVNTHDVNYSELYKEIFDEGFGKRTPQSKGFSTETKLIFTLCVDVGARPSEIRLLKKKNVDLKNWKLHFEEKTVKTLKARKVPINSQFLQSKLEDYLSSGFSPNKENFLFFNTSTQKSFASGCWRSLFREVKEQFGLDGRFYDFRHTFASKVYKLSRDIKLVADLIGDDVSTASEYYANTLIDESIEMLQNLN
jgi:integrase